MIESSGSPDFDTSPPDLDEDRRRVEAFFESMPRPERTYLDFDHRLLVQSETEVIERIVLPEKVDEATALAILVDLLAMDIFWQVGNEFTAVGRYWPWHLGFGEFPPVNPSTEPWWMTAARERGLIK